MILFVHGDAPEVERHGRSKAGEDRAGSFVGLALDHPLGPPELVAGLGEGQKFHLHRL